MPSLNQLSVSARLRLIVAIAFALFIAVIWQAVSAFGDVVLEERKAGVRSAVESAYGVLQHFHKLELAGEMSQDEARRAAMATLRELRYGEGEYFFITDMLPRTVMHAA